MFVVELLSRFFVYRGRFFGDPWRAFDSVVVGIAVVPAGGAFAVLRALRVLRLVSLVPSMRRVIGALPKALPGMASIVGLLGLVLYVVAVMATNL